MKYAVGVDLGGTKIEAALVDEKGAIHAKERVLTGVKDGPEAIFENLKLVVEAVLKEEVVGIGIGTPGFFKDSKMSSNPNVPGLAEALDLFKKEFDNVVVENDANCFALTEHRFGAGKGSKDMIGLIWGTGIGSGIIINGELYKGIIGGAGEVGHTNIDCSADDFSPGGPSTWEYHCSGPNIKKKYKEAGGSMKDLHINEIFESEEQAAIQVKNEVLRLMGVGLGNLVTIFNPELIVMGGGVSNVDVYEELNQQMKRHCISVSGESCKIVKNKLGDSSGVLGAAILVF